MLFYNKKIRSSSPGGNCFSFCLEWAWSPDTCCFFSNLKGLRGGRWIQIPNCLTYSRHIRGIKVMDIFTGRLFLVCLIWNVNLASNQFFKVWLLKQEVSCYRNTNLEHSSNLRIWTRLHFDLAVLSQCHVVVPMTSPPRTCLTLINLKALHKFRARVHPSVQMLLYQPELAYHYISNWI